LELVDRKLILVPLCLYRYDCGSDHRIALEVIHNIVGGIKRY